VKADIPPVVKASLILKISGMRGNAIAISRNLALIPIHNHGVVGSKLELRDNTGRMFQAEIVNYNYAIDLVDIGVAKLISGEFYIM
jgi:hypothetical protein